jgi:hydroxyacylglutathione hydrolase
MINIKTFTFNPFYENTFVVYDDSKKAAIIDPGCYDLHEQKELIDFISNEGLIVDKLVNTHAHIDHVLGNAFVKRQFGVELWLHEKDVPTLKAVEVYAPSYGFAAYESTEAEHQLVEGQKIVFGQTEFDVLFVPGHAPGHVAFVNEAEKVCISGDVLFNRSIGRTDLPGGDYDTLIESIHTKIFKLADEVTVYCGHGPTTTIGEEKRHNPFCAIKN